MHVNGHNNVWNDQQLVYMYLHQFHNSPFHSVLCMSNLLHLLSYNTVYTNMY